MEELYTSTLSQVRRKAVVCLRFDMDLPDVVVASQRTLQLDLGHKLSYALLGIASRRATDKVDLRVVFAVAPAKVRTLEDLFRGSKLAAGASLIWTVEGSYRAEG